MVNSWSAEAVLQRTELTIITRLTKRAALSQTRSTAYSLYRIVAFSKPIVGNCMANSITS
jgi:hypothetical protein